MSAPPACPHPNETPPKAAVDVNRSAETARAAATTANHDPNETPPKAAVDVNRSAETGQAVAAAAQADNNDENGDSSISSVAGDRVQQVVRTADTVRPISFRIRKSMLIRGRLYDVRRLLGNGSFGVCHLYEHRPTRHRVAIKVMRRDTDSLAEMTVHRQLRHANIVSWLHELQSPRHYWLVMEPCPQSLNQLLTNGSVWQMAPMRVRRLFAGALAALAYIHRSGFVHRDLKMTNLLVRNGGGGDVDETLVICDFGMAVRSVADEASAIGGSAVERRMCGTCSFLAPEMVDLQMVAHPALDVWAMGVCIYFCVVRRHAFAVADRQDTFRRIRTGVYERQPLAVLERPGGRRLMALLERVFVVDYRRRVTVNEMLEDGFFAMEERLLLAEKTGHASQHFIGSHRCQRIIRLLLLALTHSDTIPAEHMNAHSHNPPLPPARPSASSAAPVPSTSAPAYLTNGPKRLRLDTAATADAAAPATSTTPAPAPSAAAAPPPIRPFRPVWLCGWYCYDSRLLHRMCYGLSDGRIAALFADQTTAMRTFAPDGVRRTRTSYFDASGTMLKNWTPEHRSFLLAVQNAMRNTVPPVTSMTPTVAGTADVMVFVTAYLQLPNDVLVASLSNGTVQVQLQHRRFLIGERCTCEIVPTATDAAGATVRWFDRSVDPLPEQLVAELERIVKLLRAMLG